MRANSWEGTGFKMLLVTSVFGASVAVSGTASAHGTIVSPQSRVWNCREEGPETLTSAACQAARAESGSQQFYDWNGIRQGNAGGDHQAVVPDGELCSGGDPGTFGGLNLARADWVSTPVSAGPQVFEWNNSAAHATQYYRYYITNEGFDPSTPLVWSDLEEIGETEPAPADFNPSHTVTLPSRTGRHIVYSVWQRSDSPEAFYACVDVAFDGSGGGGNDPVAAPDVDMDDMAGEDMGDMAGGDMSGEDMGDMAGGDMGAEDMGDMAGGDMGEMDGGETDNTETEDMGAENACVGIPNWDQASTYTGGDQVRFNDSRYEARWWTSSNSPETNSAREWDVWIDQGSC